MIRSLFTVPTLFLGCFLFFTSACKSQKTEQISKQSAAQNAPESTLEMEGLRTDSVVQFSVMVSAILEDSQGRFWFGSHGDGLCMYDGEQYTYFTANSGLPSGLLRTFAPGPDWSIEKEIDGGNQVMSIYEDQEGIIWLRTIDGICKLKNGEFEKVEAQSGGVLTTNWSAKEWEAASKNLWFGSIDGLGLFRYDGKQLVHFTFPPPYNSETDGVSAFYQDHDGVMWLGTMGHGTFRYDGTAFIRVNDPEEIGICRAVFQDHSGRIWISNNRYSLSYYEKGKMVNYSKELLEENPQLTPDDVIRGSQSIEQDRNLDLWFGTFGVGLWRYDGKRWTHFTAADFPEVVTSKTIYRDKSGELLFGLGEGSVYRFNGASFLRFDGQQ